MHRSHYEERLHAWANNLIHHFGHSIDARHYEAWLKYVYPPTIDQSEVGTYAIVQGRLFLNELHETLNRWGDQGHTFLNDLFFWVRDKLDRKATREWGSKEEESNSAPFQVADWHEIRKLEKRR